MARAEVAAYLSQQNMLLQRVTDATITAFTWQEAVAEVKAQMPTIYHTISAALTPSLAEENRKIV